MAEMAAGAGGRSHMRASHADREQVIDLLKAAFVQGRLTKDEFELRVGQALASRTVAELASPTADIPVGLTVAAARSPRLPARGWADKKVVTLACVTAGAISLFALPYAVTVLTDGDRPHAQTVIFLVVTFMVFAMPLAAVLLKARFAKHSGSRSARRPPVTSNRALP
jgi:hypothetical protein